MASVRGLLNIQSLNELTYEKGTATPTETRNRDTRTDASELARLVRLVVATAKLLLLRNRPHP